jgi:hypothetical protein
MDAIAKDLPRLSESTSTRTASIPISRPRPLVVLCMAETLEHLRHIRVLESQVEGNREITAALRELEENLVVRIDDSASETTALVEMALSRIEELREILHRLEGKIDALALSLNGAHPSDGAVRSAQAVRSPSHTIPSSETGPSIRPCAISTNP